MHLECDFLLRVLGFGGDAQRLLVNLTFLRTSPQCRAGWYLWASARTANSRVVVSLTCAEYLQTRGIFPRKRGRSDNPKGPYPLHDRHASGCHARRKNSWAQARLSRRRIDSEDRSRRRRDDRSAAMISTTRSRYTTKHLSSLLKWTGCMRFALQHSWQALQSHAAPNVGRPCGGSAGS